MQQRITLIIIVVLLVIAGAWLISSRNQVVSDENPVNGENETGAEDNDVVDDDATEGDERLDDTNEDEAGDIDATDDSQEAAAVKEFTITGEEFSFSEEEMTVNEGDTVRLTFVNGGTMPHNWILNEFNTGTEVLQPGEQEVVEFVATTAGTFEYYCSVGSHREMGMVGTLIVE